MYSRKTIANANAIVKKEFLQIFFLRTSIKVVGMHFYALLLFMCLLSDTAPLLRVVLLYASSPPFLPLDLGLKVKPKEKADVVLREQQQR